MVVITDDNGPIDAARRAPHNIRARSWLHGAVDDDGVSAVVVELEGALREAVVHGVVLVRPPVVAADELGGFGAGELVYEDPLLDGWDEGDDGHAGAIRVGPVGDVVDDGAPGEKVLGDLVGELLAVEGVALVGVEDADGTVFLVWPIMSVLAPKMCGHARMKSFE